MADEENIKSALNKAMALCSQREFCCEDIRNKLIQWNVEKDDCENIIDRLINENFINEQRYASAFVTDKFRYNKWGKVKIASQLRFKKVPSDIIKNALNTIDDETYMKTLYDLIHTHRKTIRAKNKFDLKGRLLRFGLSKGFESELLYDILNDTVE